MIGYFDVYRDRTRVVMNDDGTWSCDDKTTLRVLNGMFGLGTFETTHTAFGVGRLGRAARFFGEEPVVLVPPLPPTPPGFHF